MKKIILSIGLLLSKQFYAMEEQHLAVLPIFNFLPELREKITDDIFDIPNHNQEKEDYGTCFYTETTCKPFLKQCTELSIINKASYSIFKQYLRNTLLPKIIDNEPLLSRKMYHYYLSDRRKQIEIINTKTSTFKCLSLCLASQILITYNNNHIPPTINHLSDNYFLKTEDPKKSPRSEAFNIYVINFIKQALLLNRNDCNTPSSIVIKYQKRKDCSDFLTDSYKELGEQYGVNMKCEENTVIFTLQ